MSGGKVARWVHRTVSFATTPPFSCAIATTRFTDRQVKKCGQWPPSRNYGDISVLPGPAHFDFENDLPAPVEGQPVQNNALAQQVNEQEKVLSDVSSHVDTADTEQERHRRHYDVLAGLPVDMESSLLDVDYATALGQALADSNVDLVFRCLLAAAKKEHWKFISGISNGRFTQILELLEPARSIGELAETHTRISPVQQAILQTAPMGAVAQQHYKMLHAIFKFRRRAGVELNLQQYLSLLRSARDLGKPGFAYRLFRHLRQAGHATDIQCWNYLMEAVLLDGQHRSESRQAYRITARNLEGRAAPVRHKRFANYRVGDTVIGLKSVQSKLFEEMCNSGATADQETYRILLTSAAREGDMGTVVAVLKSAWGVEITESGSSSVAFVHSTHDPAKSKPEFDQQMLLAIAQAFVINNDVALALRVLDFISHEYQVPIETQIWEELLQYTFTLAKPRPGQKMDAAGDKVGQLPLISVQQLWQTFTQEPYNVKPTKNMYKYLVKSWYYARNPREMLKAINESIEVFANSEDGQRDLEMRLAHAASGGNEDVSSLRLKWEAKQLDRRAHAGWIRRSVQLLLASTQENVDVKGDLTLRELPRAIRSRRVWMPFRVKYEVLGGIVEFDCKADAAHRKLERYKANRAEVMQQIINRAPRLVGQYRHVKICTGDGTLLPVEMIRR